MMVENETNYPPPQKKKIIINYIKQKNKGKHLIKKTGGKTFGAINIGHLRKKSDNEGLYGTNYLIVAYTDFS